MSFKKLCKGTIFFRYRQTKYKDFAITFAFLDNLFILCVPDSKLLNGEWSELSECFLFTDLAD